MDGRISQKITVALKLLQLTRFLSLNLSIYCYLLSFSTMLGICCDVDFSKLNSSAQYINREVYALSNFL